jgi:hypothetical protein
MKKRTILFLAMSLLIFTQCKKDKSCKKDIPEWCNTVDLSNDYNPVCGCDGITYQNAGHAECIGGVSYTPGACK